MIRTMLCIVALFWNLALFAMYMSSKDNLREEMSKYLRRIRGPFTGNEIFWWDPKVKMRMCSSVGGDSPVLSIFTVVNLSQNTRVKLKKK